MLIELKANPDDTISQIKQRLHAELKNRHSPYADEPRLIHGGVELDNSKKLRDYMLTSDNYEDVIIITGPKPKTEFKP